MKTIPIHKAPAVPQKPVQQGEPGGKCDRCLQEKTCKRINYCPGYKKKFGKWEKL